MGLSRTQLEDAVKLARIMRGRWRPQSGAQTAAYESVADIVGYGGAAGGGKTDLALGLAHTQHERSIIFRREGTQLNGMIERSREIFTPLGARYVGQPWNVWRFPDGRHIEFGSVQYLGDEIKYQGRPHDLVAFDEATHFIESQVRFLLGWLRNAKSPSQRCRALLTFNPPTSAEGQWIVPFFAPWLDPKHRSPAKPGELRWFISDEEGRDREVDSPEPLLLVDGKSVKPLSRTFIPARLDDNAYLRDTNYRAVLQGLPEPLRSQMLHGDFWAGNQDAAWQLIPSKWITAAIDSHVFLRIDVTGDSFGALDVADEGGDANAFCGATGPMIQVIEEWSGKGADLFATTQRAFLLCDQAGYKMLRYDADGLGAGVRGDARVINDGRGDATIEAVGFRGSSAVVDPDGEDVLGRLNKDFFANRKAQSWWALRRRFEATYRAVREGAKFDPGEIISIGGNLALRAKLCAELAQPTYSITPGGKILVDKAPDGVSSPNLSDAVMIRYARMARTMSISEDFADAFKSALRGRRR